MQKKSTSPVDMKPGKTSEQPSKCCSPENPCSAPSAYSVEPKTSSFPAHTQTDKTRIIVKHNIGFNNTLYLRGNGMNLNWNKGVPLKNVKADEWMWETDLPFSAFEFKVLINDRQYETGDNHRMTARGTMQYTPRF